MDLLNEQPPQIIIREMKPEDINAVINLWYNNSDGLGLSTADTPEKIAAYIQHNDHMSFVAEEQSLSAEEPSQIIGTILAGTDMRRTYINHLFVLEKYRHLHIGSMLVEAVENRHKHILPDRCYIFVYKNNIDAQKFWEAQGYTPDPSLLVMKKDV